MPVLVVISTLDGGRRNEALRLPAPELASKLGLFRSSAVIVPASTLARTRAPSGTLMRPCTRQRPMRPARPDAPPPGVPTLSMAPPTLSMAMLVRSVEGYVHVRHSR